MANGIFFDLTTVNSLKTPKITSGTGKVLLQTYNASTFSMLQFGGTTAAYPALKLSNDASTLLLRKANDSAYAHLVVGNLTVTGTTTGVSGGTTLPSQTDNGNKLLATDGTDPYWTSSVSLTANNDFALDVAGTGLNTSYGRQQLRISSSASEAGMYFKNEGSGGRNYAIFVTASASSLGGGKFVIADATTGASRIELASNGHTTFYNDVIVDDAGSLVFANQVAFHSAGQDNITIYKGDWSGMGNLSAATITATAFVGAGALITGVPHIVSVPSSSSATGTVGQVAYDSSYFYVCTATNTWVRTPVATW